MLFVSDVHGASSALKRVVATGEVLFVLGDLVNLTDYRNGDGAVADVLGLDFANEVAIARARGDYAGMRQLWSQRAEGDFEGLRSAIGDALLSQYEEMGEALAGGSGFVIHGNVDRPQRLRAALPRGFRYVHGEVVEQDGLRLGLVGGGVPTPMAVDGEVSDEEMTVLLEGLGNVDVLCTHVPPAIGPLRRDVITGREERGSGPIYEYIVEYQPRFHLFGDVHQAMATTWRIGSTRCYNAGYFRATGRYLTLSSAMVHTGRVG